MRTFWLFLWKTVFIYKWFSTFKDLNFSIICFCICWLLEITARGVWSQDIYPASFDNVSQWIIARLVGDFDRNSTSHFMLWSDGHEEILEILWNNESRFWAASMEAWVEINGEQDSYCDGVSFLAFLILSRYNFSNS